MQDFNHLLEHESQEPKAGDLERLLQLANLQEHLQDRLKELEQKCKEVKERLNKVALEQLPELMLSLGMQEFTMTNGKKVTVKEGVSPSVNKSNMPLFLDWLEGAGEDGIVKTTMEFGKLPTEIKQKIMITMQETYGLAPKINSVIHPATFKKFINETFYSSEPQYAVEAVNQMICEKFKIKEEVLKVFPYKQAIIK